MEPTVYPPTTPALTAPCDPDSPDDGWVANPSGNLTEPFCYYFDHGYDGQVSWMNASAQCRAKGGLLASIHSEEENGFLVSNLEKTNSWIGFNQMYSGDWKWPDNSDVGFARWSPGGELIQHL